MTQKNKNYKTNFVSEIDRFFHDFDRNRRILPDARLQEVKKAKAIADKRDNTQK